MLVVQKITRMTLVIVMLIGTNKNQPCVSTTTNNYVQWLLLHVLLFVQQTIMSNACTTNNKYVHWTSIGDCSYFLFVFDVLFLYCLSWPRTHEKQPHVRYICSVSDIAVSVIVIVIIVIIVAAIVVVIVIVITAVLVIDLVFYCHGYCHCHCCHCHCHCYCHCYCGYCHCYCYCLLFIAIVM